MFITIQLERKRNEGQSLPDLSRIIQNNLNMDIYKMKICNLICWMSIKVAIER